jgi:anti-sigma-K factor RskA
MENYILQVAAAAICAAVTYTVTSNILQRRMNKSLVERLEHLELWATNAGTVIAALGVIESLRQGNESGVIQAPVKSEDTKH